MEITPNIVVCPHCNKEFEHNRVNGLALLEIARTVDARKRMRCRLTLDAIERAIDDAVEFRVVKKAVLDGYNDLARDINTILGFGVDVE